MMERPKPSLLLFTTREAKTALDLSFSACVSSLFFFLSDFVRRLLLYTRGLFYAESFSFTTLMRFLLSSVCSELSKKRLRSDQNPKQKSFFLFFETREKSFVALVFPHLFKVHSTSNRERD